MSIDDHFARVYQPAAPIRPTLRFDDVGYVISYVKNSPQLSITVQCDCKLTTSEILCVTAHAMNSLV